MKHFFRIASSIGYLCLYLAMATLQANAVDVSSAAISLDLAAGSVELYESEGVTYCVQNEMTQATTGGMILRQTNNATATSNTVTVSGGSCKVTISSLNIEAKDYNSPIAVEEDATLDLNLLGVNTVIGGRFWPGIYVPNDASLIIRGQGNIVTTGGDHGSGIGGRYDYGIGIASNAGTIVINEGVVTAIGGDFSAGIGGACNGNGGTVVINGGTVTASSLYNGAGIGGGMHGNGGTIVINGGIVTANGNYHGAGIGGGENGCGGTITIHAGRVTAVGGEWSKDIGYGTNGAIDEVTISDVAIVTNGDGQAPFVRETIFIVSEPRSSAAYLNNTPLSYVTVRSHSGLTYQWQISSDNKNWTELEGETAAETAVLAMTEELDGAYLRCALTNGWSNVEYTDSVQIYILAFAKQPTSVEANLNEMIVFEAISTCSNVTYQWQRSYDEGATWSNIDDETFSTLIVNATLAESSAKYRCVITATNGDQLASDVVSVNLDLGELVTYTVQDYMQNADGDGYTMTSQQVLEGISGEIVNTSNGGYDGFKLNKTKSVLSGAVASDSSLVLTRYFDRKTYSIDFETNGGGALPDLEALYGAKIEAPTNPSRYGYVFIDWYADEELTEEYVFDTMPLNGIKVYAKWAPVGADRGIEYTINGLAIRDSSKYEVLDDIPADDFLVEVSVTNLEATETDTILLVYYTEQGQMVGMNYMFTNIPAGYTATLGALVDNDDGEVGIVKAFVLPSLGNPIPLAESKVIEK